MADEVIKVRLPQLPLLEGQAEPEDLIFVWDTSAGAMKRAEVSQLAIPSGDGGSGNGSGGATTFVGSPFKVRTADEQYEFDGTSTIISDIRLIGKTDYPVYSTQLNAEFRAEDLEYDPANGSVTVVGFQLQEGQHLTLYPDGLASQSSGETGSLQVILNRIEKLEKIAAPFIPSTGAKGGVVLWMKPANEIPVGWQEVTSLKGRIPVGFDVDNTLFNLLGKTGGSATHTNTLEEMVPHAHDYTSPGADGDHPGGKSGYDRPNSKVGATTSTNGGFTENGIRKAKPYSIMNPYRVVLFIEYIGE